MEIVGRSVATGICKNCGGKISYIEWDGSTPNGWSHDDQPQGPWCPGQYVAEPEE